MGDGKNTSDYVSDSWFPRRCVRRCPGPFAVELTDRPCPSNISKVSLKLDFALFFI